MVAINATPPIFEIGRCIRKRVVDRHDIQAQLDLLGRSKRGSRYLSCLHIEGDDVQHTHELLPSWKRSSRGTTGDYPLHAPKLSVAKPLLYDDILASPVVSVEKKDAIAYLFDIRKYPPIPRYYDEQTVSVPTSAVSDEDMMILLDRDIFEECLFSNHNPLDHWGYIFTVVEEIKKRRRLVHDSLSANVLCDEPFKVQFTPLSRLKRVVHKGSHCVTFDIKAMYYHFELAPEIREMFKIKARSGRFYRSKRMPMGFKWSVDIAQTITEYLASFLLNVHCEVYIDNLFIVGSYEDCLRARSMFLAVCEKYSITLGEASEVSQSGVYRGIEFDLRTKRVRIAASFIEKFASRAACHTNEWADWRALIASLIYAATIEDSLHSIYHLLKFLARHAKSSPKSICSLWREAQHEFDVASNRLRDNRWMTVLDPSERIVIVTDACTESHSGGYVIVTPNGRVITKSFDLHLQDINVMEAQALLFLLHDQPNLLQYRQLYYFGDNTAVLHTLHSGHSKSFHLNLTIGRIVQRTHNLHSTITPFYIPSEWNPADAPSRYVSFSDLHRVSLSFLQRLASSWGVE